ncbi:MAG: hypothetical protein IJA23_06415 [Clostridia bacterium]|nr:hypothetical protein [Clostridia bacterium]
MLDLEEIRNEDIVSGRFDIYTDDIDFTEDQYVELRMKDKVRLSSVNPYDIENPEIFEHIKKVTDYIKRVADAVCPNGYKVFDNKIISYVKVILSEVNKNPNVLENVSDALFKENYLLEAILIRDLVVQSNKIKNEYDEESEEINEYLGDLYFKFKQIEEIINRKKYNKKNFNNNIVMKKTDERYEKDDLSKFSNKALIDRINDEDNTY